MKENKLKKIVKLVVEEIKEIHNKQPVSEKIYTDDWAAYDEEVSGMLKKMLLNLLNYRNNINININNYSLSISTDNLSGIKKTSSSSGLTKISDDDYFSVEIIKGTGFTINKGYRIRTQYLDNKIYDEILPLATNKLREINRQNFDNIWNDAMKESGLIRDNNIDELLKN
jgi:hypothetical protein